MINNTYFLVASREKNLTGFFLSKAKQTIILDYLKPYHPLGSVCNSLKIQNEP